VVATVGERSLNISRQRVGHGKKVTLVSGNKLTTYKKDPLNTYLRYFSLSSSALHVKLKTQSLSNSWVVQSSDLDAAFGLKEHISGSHASSTKSVHVEANISLCLLPLSDPDCYDGIFFPLCHWLIWL
jgi:hypothetical protein